MKKYPKNSKTVRALQNSLFIHKMFANPKKCLLNRKMFGNFENRSTNLQNIVRPFQKCSPIQEIVKTKFHNF